MRAAEPVSRFMSEAVVVIEADRPVSEVLSCFLQYPIHHLPVVRDGRLVGMLSSADAMKLEYFLPKGARDRAAFLDQHVTIERLMRTPPLSVAPHTSLEQAAERMITAGVHAVAVVDEADRVLGLLTSSDIIRSLLHGAPRRGDVAPSPPSPPAEAENHYHRRPTDAEYATAILAAEALHVGERDAKHLGKCVLYLDQRCESLEKVLTLAERFLQTGQDEQVHAHLLKAIYAARRVEEHATSAARVPFALE